MLSKLKGLNSSIDRSAPELPRTASKFSKAVSKFNQSGETIVSNPRAGDCVDGEETMDSDKRFDTCPVPLSRVAKGCCCSGLAILGRLLRELVIGLIASTGIALLSCCTLGTDIEAGPFDAFFSAALPKSAIRPADHQFVLNLSSSSQHFCSSNFALLLCVGTLDWRSCR